METNTRSFGFMSASNFTDFDVKNDKGEDLGDIKDVVVDTEAGCIAYAVLSFGGFMGMGDKLFAIPWEALKFQKDKDYVVLNVDKEKLENAPGFDKDNWPTSPDRSFVTDIHQHYGYTPYWERYHIEEGESY